MRVIGDRLVLANHHHPAVACPKHLDRGSVQAAEFFSRDHIFWAAGNHMAVGHVNHSMDEGQDWIYVVCYQKYSHALLLTDVADQRRDRLLIVEVKAV